MTRFVIASSPIHGHVAPLARIAAHLVEAGHEVTFLTGSRFRQPVENAGARHVPLPAAVDYDAQDLNASFPGRSQLSGMRQIVFDIQHTFIGPMAGQAAVLRELAADIILAETAFLGAVPLLVDGERPRPPIVNIGITPLTLSSRDTAPWGPGLPPGRLRNRLLTVAVQRLVFGGNQRYLNRTLHQMGLPACPVFVLDWPRLADRVLQLGVPGFEHPRSDLPSHVRFVGAVPSQPVAEGWAPPPWWPDLDAAKAAGRPVVHVTQGTVANTDLGQLIAPTLQALARDDVLVVVSTGGRDFTAIPDNARLAPFIPYADLLPLVDVMVTNGGFGGTQLALSHGIPVVVAGISEDKAEVASRVTTSGVGINLRTSTPEPGAVAAAVRTVLSEPGYRDRARELAAEYARYDALALIDEELTELVARAEVAPA